MPLAVFAGFLVLGLALTLAVRKVSEERRVLLHVIAFASLGIVVGKVLESALPDAELLFDGSDAFVYLERDIAIPAAMLFFATAARLVPDPRNKRSVALLPWVLAVYLVAANAWTFTTPECYRDSPLPDLWRKGVCFQSTGYTCGAASVATVVSANGVAVTEHEVARLSFTVPYRGVTDLGCAMALRRKLPGKRVRLQKCKVSELASVKLPCLAPLTYSFWFDHMVTILKIEKRGILVGDPLQGPVLMAQDELEKQWKDRVITVE